VAAAVAESAVNTPAVKRLELSSHIMEF
jgi:hypothetical protein